MSLLVFAAGVVLLLFGDLLRRGVRAPTECSLDCFVRELLPGLRRGVHNAATARSAVQVIAAMAMSLGLVGLLAIALGAASLFEAGSPTWERFRGAAGLWVGGCSAWCAAHAVGYSRRLGALLRSIAIR